MTIPETIANDVCRSCVRDQVEAAPLANGDSRLHESILCHVDLSTATGAGAHTALLETPRLSTARHHEERDDAQDQKNGDKLFHRVSCFSCEH